MGKVAAIFPGQGVQAVGMGREIHEANAEVREIFDQANQLMGLDLRSLMFEGPEDELTRTANAQPAILTANFAFFRLTQERTFSFQGAAGHSLGEYNALIAAGSLTFEDALTAVKERGRLMEEVGAKTRGTMAAILRLEEEKLEAVCREASEEGLVEIANYNCPGQLVISGEIPAVEKACELAKKEGARRAIRLKVGGAFHSALLQEAADRFGAVLDAIPFKEPACDLYVNVTGARETDPDALRELLKEQLRSPVLWERLVRCMIADGYTAFTEVGPGNVLTGLVSQTSKETERKNINSLSALESL